MNCPICNKLGNELPSINVPVERWKCDNHKYVITYAMAGSTLLVYSYSFFKNEKEYGVFAFFNTSSGNIWELRDESNKSIVRFNYIPDNITPNNIDQKFNILIIFS